MSPIATAARKTEAQNRARQQQALSFGKTAGLSGGAEGIFRRLAKGVNINPELEGSDIFNQASEAFKRFEGDQSVQTVGGAGPDIPAAGPITPPAPPVTPTLTHQATATSGQAAAATPSPSVPTDKQVIGKQPFTEAQEGIDQQAQQRNELVDAVVKAIQDKPTQASTFEKVFGAESSIQQFFSPALKTAQQQVLDVEGALSNLPEDIQKRFEDVGISDPQRARIETQERGELTKQFDELTRGITRLQTGLELQLGLGEKEFDAEIKDSQRGIDEAIFRLENLGLPGAQVDLIKRELENNLQKAVEGRSELRTIATEARAEQKAEKKITAEQKQAKEDAVQEILTNTQNFLTQAGVVPTTAFAQVISDVQDMLSKGATISEVQLAITQAIGENPQVREFITDQFKIHKANLKKALAGKAVKDTSVKVNSSNKILLAASHPDIYSSPDDVPDNTSDLPPEHLQEIATRQGSDIDRILAGLLSGGGGEDEDDKK